MTEELKQAAQAALEQLEFLNACYPHKTATDAADALRRALTQRPAAQTEREAPYGYCPECSAPGAMRERRPNGDDKCSNGHRYPSRTARASLTAPQQATPEPVPAEQAKWCEYVAGMVDCWINSHWPNYNHMDEDRRVKAIAGIIERRLWALQKQAAATPEPVGESAGRIELDCRQWLEDQRIDGGPHGFEAVGVEALSRMWRAARASNQTELVGEVSAESILNQWMAECGVYMVEKMGHQWASQTKQADLLYLVEKAITCTRPAPGVPEVDDLAQFIRQIDGKHSMGAGALAEHICDWLAAAQAKGADQ